MLQLDIDRLNSSFDIARPIVSCVILDEAGATLADFPTHRLKEAPVPTDQARTPSAPVLVAGAGPVGMTLALELAHHGVRTILVERNPHTTTYPKMDLTNVRSMELFKRLGIVPDIRSAGVAPEHSFDVIFADSLAGKEIGRWDLPSVDAMRATISEHGEDGTQPAEPWQRIMQVEMEELLMLRCLENERIEVLRPYAVSDVTQDDEGVSTTIVSRKDDETRTIRSSYVVGCDGANSAVRQSLGINETGDRAVAMLLQLHFRSQDFTALHAHGQFWHVFFLLRGFSAIIAQDERETWTVHQQLFEDTELSQVDPMASPKATLGTPVQIDALLETSIWRPNVLVADNYRSGRVFIAGDAAHQVIPTGGYGMNSGIADAVDIGWKLAGVVNGWGGPGLLDSYEVERHPIACTNRDFSFRHLEVHLKAQGLVEAEHIGEQTDEGEANRRHVAEHYEAERGENESWGLELGYRYADSPIVASESGEAPAQEWHTYRPTTTPGSRAPHVPLADGRSPLDLYPTGYTLIDFSGAGDGIARAAERLSVPSQHVDLSGEAAARRVYERDLVLVRPDGHVAWRGDVAPDDAAAVVARATGHNGSV